MESLVFVGLLLAGALLVAPIASLIVSLGLRRRLAVVEGELAARRAELRWLYDQLNALRAAAPAGTPATSGTGPHGSASPVADARTATSDANATPGAGASGSITDGSATPDADARAATSDASATPGADASGSIPDASAPPGATATPDASAPPGATATPDASAPPNATAPPDATAPPGAGPRRAPRPPAPRPAAAEPALSFEQRLATYFTRIGAGAMVLGVLYFFKYAADNEWIGPAGRVLLGAVFGVAILVAGEVVRPKTHPGFVHALVGVGIAVLYVSAWASAARYELVSTSAAFGAGTVVLLLGAALAYRHSGEAVLLLVLVAGFLNPVLLSTGVDRPFALFSYLTMLTGVALVVAVLRSMRFAIVLSVLGVIALFVGWHSKYFDVHDFTQVADLPPEHARGAYLELSARIVPIAFVTIFAAEWIWSAVALVQREVLGRMVKPLAIVALVFAHAGLASLLPDRPIVLGIGMIVLGAASIAVCRMLEATRYLLIPMLAAFLFLAAFTGDTPAPDQLLLLAVLGVWCGLYVEVFLRDGFREAANHRRAAIQAGVALACFAAIASWTLLSEDRYLALAGFLVAWSAVVVAIALRAGFTPLSLCGVVFSFPPFAVAASMAVDDAEHASLAFIGLSLGWGAAYVAGVVIELRRRTEGRPLSLIVVATATLAALALTIIATPEDEPTLRAILTAAVGAGFLGLAVHVQSRRPELDAWVRIFAAVAIALFAPAIAFALSGATVTIAWAILAAVSLAILADAREPAEAPELPDWPWIVVSILLVAATTFRVFAVDFAAVEAQRQLFEVTRGRSGALDVRPFFNPRAYAFVGSGLALLGGAVLLAREIAAKRRRVPLPLLGAVVIIAWSLITIALVLETRGALVDVPRPPPHALDPQEFEVFMQSVFAAEAEGSHLRAMATTVVLALVAMLLLGIGFAARDVFHRYLGLALFAATLGKLVLWDVWNLARIYQIVVLGVVGALLLASGFLYARLKALFRTGGPPALCLAASLLLGDEARAQEPPPKAPEAPVHLFRHRAPIEGVVGPGDHRLRVTPDLLTRSLSDVALGDLRVVDGEGREVPFFTRVEPPLRVVGTTPGRIFDGGHIDGGGYRATFELPPSTEHCQVQLELEGEPPYLRRTRIETGHTPSDLQTVSEGAMVFAAQLQGLQATSSTLRYALSKSRYVRVTLLNDPDASPTVITGGVFSCGGEDSLPRFGRLPLTVMETRQNTTDKTTEIDLDAGATGVPIEKLAIRITTPEFVRRVRVFASSHRSVWPPVGSGVVYRVEREGPESTTIELETSRRQYLRLVIEDGSDAPLTIPLVEGVYAEQEILFRASTTSGLALYVGDDKGRASRGGGSYDYQSIIERREEPTAWLDARLGAFADNPDFGKEKPKTLPFTEQHRGVIGVALTVAVLGLALWAIRLIRTSAR